jgi:hypothetical protein
MRLNSKVTWGLAWTGLAFVLAVPSLDFLTGKLGKSDAAAVLTSDVDPVQTAAVEPAAIEVPAKTVTTIKTKNGVTIVPAGSAPPAADPVDKMLSGGKSLPDYISDDQPAKVELETQVAAIDPTPPTPFPSWGRSKAMATPVAPVVTAPAVTSPEPVVIVDDSTLTGSIDQPTVIAPPTSLQDDSANWDTETLRQYLQRRGVLEGGDSESTATVTERDSTYDPDGFYLSDGPNSDRTTRETRRQRVLRMLEESGEDPDSFTLF